MNNRNLVRLITLLFLSIFASPASAEEALPTTAESNAIFNSKRMAYGGFKTLVQA